MSEVNEMLNGKTKMVLNDFAPDEWSNIRARFDVLPIDREQKMRCDM